MTYVEMTVALSKAKATRSKAEKGEMIGKLLLVVNISASSVADYNDAVKKLEVAVRLRCAEEKGITPGVFVSYEGRSVQIRSIGKDGRIRLQGVGGSFHPIGLNVAGEKDGQ